MPVPPAGSGPEPDFLPPGSETGPASGLQPLESVGSADEPGFGAHDFDADDDRGAISSHIPAWYTVRVGLRVATVASWVLVVGGVALALAMGMMLLDRWSYLGARDAGPVAGGVAGICITGGLVAFIVASGFYLFAPPVAGVRVTGRVGFFLLLSPLAFVLLLLLTRARDGEAFAVLMMVTGGAGLICGMWVVRLAGSVFRAGPGVQVLPVSASMLVVTMIVMALVMIFDRPHWSVRETREPLMAIGMALAGAVAFASVAISATRLARAISAALPTMRPFAASGLATRSLSRDRAAAGSAAGRVPLPDGWEALRVPVGSLRVTVYRRRLDDGWVIAGSPDDDEAHCHRHPDPDHSWRGEALPPGCWTSRRARSDD